MGTHDVTVIITILLGHYHISMRSSKSNGHNWPDERRTRFDVTTVKWARTPALPELTTLRQIPETRVSINPRTSSGQNGNPGQVCVAPLVTLAGIGLKGGGAYTRAQQAEARVARRPPGRPNVLWHDFGLCHWKLVWLNLPRSTFPIKTAAALAKVCVHPFGLFRKSPAARPFS